MFRSVMVPAGFTDECALVLRFAEGLPALGVKRIVLGHVVEASGMEGPIIAASLDKVRDRIRAMTSRLSDAGLDVEVRVGTGDAASGLLAIAAENRVDAVVMGTHGKGVLSTLIAGSVSEQMAIEADVPTMLVRYSVLGTRDEPSEFARSFGSQVLVPTDFSSASLRALMCALEMPEGAIGNLVLLHVADSGQSLEKLRRAEEGAEFQLQSWSRMAEERGLKAQCVVRRGDPNRVVLKEIEERGVTGVIVGSRGQHALQAAILGSTSMTLLRRSPCPVLIVP